MLEEDDRANLVAYIVTGMSLSDAITSVDVAGQDVIDALLSDTGFACAMVFAQGERDSRLLRAIALDVGRAATNADDAASASRDVESAIKEMRAIVFNWSERSHPTEA